MKEIKRFDVVLTDNSVDELVESKNGYWCRYEDAEQLQTKIKDLKSRIDFCMTMDKQNQQIIEQAEERIKELESAERTLINLGYENNGGEMWKPPIGNKPNFNLLDELNDKIEKLQSRIKELESDKHIDEIKAQGICWALELASFDCTVHDDPVSVLEKVEKYAEQLRNTNETKTN